MDNDVDGWGKVIPHFGSVVSYIQYLFCSTCFDCAKFICKAGYAIKSIYKKAQGGCFALETGAFSRPRICVPNSINADSIGHVNCNAFLQVEEMPRAVHVALPTPNKHIFVFQEFSPLWTLIREPENCQRHTERMWSVRGLICLWFLSLPHYSRAFPNPPNFIHCRPKYGENIDVHACVAALATMPTGQAIRTFFADFFMQPNEPRPQEWNGAEKGPVVYGGATG